MKKHKPKSFFESISMGKFNRGMVSLCTENLKKNFGRMNIISTRYNKYMLKKRDGFPLMSQSDMYDNMWSVNDPLNLGMPEIDYYDYDIHPNLMQISVSITKEEY